MLRATLAAVVAGPTALAVAPRWPQSLCRMLPWASRSGRCRSTCTSEGRDTRSYSRCYR